MEKLDKSQTNAWGEHAAAPNTHNRVGELIEKYLPSLRGLNLLDVPCGAGLFSAELAARGAQVEAMDIAHVDPFRFDPARRTLANANEGLPYAAGRFDAVVTIEGIEHLENPSFFLRECARVIHDRGLIFLSTPNPDSLRSRRYVFTRGYHRYFHAVNDTVKDSGHLLPIDMIFVRGACARAGLEVVETAVNQLKGRNPMTELLRGAMTRRLPSYMQGEIPFYGDVIMYVLRKKQHQVN